MHDYLKLCIGGAVAFLGTMPAMGQETTFVFVPEGSSIVCTLEEGCLEADGSTIDYSLRGKIEGQPILLAMARSMLIERAMEEIETIGLLMPVDLLTNDLAYHVVVENRWGNLRGATYAAREEVFSRYLCPIFNHYEDPYRACWSAREFDRSDAEHRGIPAELSPLVREMRAILYNIGRQHLKKPENLHLLYQETRGAILRGYDDMLYDEQIAFRTMVQTGIQTLAEFREPQVQAHLEAFYQAEGIWSGDITTGNNSTAAYEAMVAAEEVLNANTADPMWIRFWFRRNVEGGPELLTAYGEILQDILNQTE